MVSTQQMLSPLLAFLFSGSWPQKSSGKVGVYRGTDVMEWMRSSTVKGHLGHQGQTRRLAPVAGLLMGDGCVSQQVSWPGAGTSEASSCTACLRPLLRGRKDCQPCFSLPSPSFASHSALAFFAHLSIHTQPSVASPKW